MKKGKSLMPVRTLCYNECTHWLTRRKAMNKFLDYAHNSEGCERERYMNVYIQLNEGNTFAWDMKYDVQNDLALSIYRKQPVRDFTLMQLHKFAAAYLNKDISEIEVQMEDFTAEEWQEFLNDL